MKLRWTFGQKTAFGFATVILLTLLGSILSVRALRTVVLEKDEVLNGNARTLIDAAKFKAAVEWQVAAARGFLLTGRDAYLTRLREASAEVARLTQEFEARATSEEARALLRRIRQAEADHEQASGRVIAARQDGTGADELAQTFDETVTPRRLALDELIVEFVALHERQLVQAQAQSTNHSVSAERIVIGITLGVVLVGTVLSIVLTRRLAADIGSAIQHIRGSSAELQAAANQQVTSIREQATSMSEIGTTVSELLATSRQIADTSQRVAHIAEEATGAARSGDITVRSGHDSISSIKKQIDHVVAHMLELGKKSQQIGGVIDIINELSEQTNILSINASIEAAGAGESGRRFAVVADEIRKLAERVGGSTREIATLIEEIRAAVNTAVMATEGGAKAVEAGTRQFGDVASAFARIVTLVGTSTEAAREIELSTKQQSTAIEQVNLAIVSAAQAAKEAEASSAQTLQTAGQLATLSGELSQLV